MMFKKLTTIVLLGAAMSLPHVPAWAGAKDYVFEPVKVEVKNGPGSELLVRLVHKPTGKPIEGALIVKTRLDMTPEGMEAMTAKHVAEPAAEPGVYRFKADLTMAGNWALKLMAKVQGEPETIEGMVVFKSKDCGVS
ncbi:MAG: FixH family protein [Hyphomicrobiaceae bacterium]